MALGLCVTVGLSACGGWYDRITGPDEGPPASVSKTLDAAGGRVELPQGVAITVPAGALSSPTTIAITQTSEGAPPNLPQGSDLALAQSKVYELTPHDVSFDKPVTVRIPIDSTQGTPRVYVSDRTTGWYPHQTSATGDGWVEIQRTAFSWVYIVIPKTDTGKNALIPLASYSKLDIASPVNLRVNGPEGTLQTSSSAMADWVYDPGFARLSANAGIPASGVFTVTSYVCHAQRLALDLLISNSWVTLDEFAVASTDGDDGHFIVAKHSHFNVRFTPIVTGDFDMRLRAVCSNAVDLKSYDPRLVDATWKVRMHVDPSYSVGGTVSGLPADSSIQLALNGGAPQTVSTNGAFTLNARLADKAAYAVTAAHSPTNYTCSVVQGMGSIVAADVSNVAVTCASNTPTHQISGDVFGLPTGGSVALLLNGASAQTVTNPNGTAMDFLPFSLTAGITPGATFSVTAGTVTVPGGANYSCSVGGGNGAMPDADVTNLMVNCTPADPFSLSGDVSGQGSGPYPSLLLMLNGDAANQIR